MSGGDYLSLLLISFYEWNISWLGIIKQKRRSGSIFNQIPYYLEHAYLKCFAQIKKYKYKTKAEKLLYNIYIYILVSYCQTTSQYKKYITPYTGQSFTSHFSSIRITDYYSFCCCFCRLCDGHSSLRQWLGRHWHRWIHGRVAPSTNSGETRLVQARFYNEPCLKPMRANNEIGTWLFIHTVKTADGISYLTYLYGWNIHRSQSYNYCFKKFWMHSIIPQNTYNEKNVYRLIHLTDKKDKE